MYNIHDMILIFPRNLFFSLLGKLIFFSIASRSLNFGFAQCGFGVHSVLETEFCKGPR